MSTSRRGNVGSPSSRNATKKGALSSDNARLAHLDGDDPDSQGTPRGKKRGGHGLCQISMKVCKEVESKGRTTYDEVADELVAKFTFDEKNIRRRVYDVLNVLEAMDIIAKDKKHILWKGFGHTKLKDSEELKEECVGRRNKIEKKVAYLKELEEQCIGLKSLKLRNEQIYGSDNAPTRRVELPFILVQTRPHATVEVEISEDMQLVHFDFNTTPFELHDDNYVLNAMRISEIRQGEDNVVHDYTANGGES